MQADPLFFFSSANTPRKKSGGLGVNKRNRGYPAGHRTPSKFWSRFRNFPSAFPLGFLTNLELFGPSTRGHKLSRFDLCGTCTSERLRTPLLVGILKNFLCTLPCVKYSTMFRTIWSYGGRNNLIV